jgi:hypothetical protein
VGNGALKESINKSGYLCGVIGGTKIEMDRSCHDRFLRIFGYFFFDDFNWTLQV